MKEAMFYEKLDDKKVQCHLCAFNCLIPEGQVGRCRVRKNINGKLYSLVYDKVNTIVVNPIEKKPLYHFAPGSSCLSISTVGCNWQCKFCCNWQTSTAAEIEGEALTPEEIVKMAIENNCQGISYTFTEPTIFYELSYETARLAHQKGLYNTWVSNGYTNKEPIKKIAPYLDAVTIDFKGSGEEKFLREFSNVPSNKPIYEALKEYKKAGIHIEITDLIVPEIGDSSKELKKLVKWIKENLGEETPFHLLRFFPTYQLLNLPQTPFETLEKAYEIAKKEGLKYVYPVRSKTPLVSADTKTYRTSNGVYLGNNDNTYCPKCKELLIKRSSMRTLEYKIKNGKCSFCGEKINIRGEKWIKKF